VGRKPGPLCHVLRDGVAGWKRGCPERVAVTPWLPNWGLPATTPSDTSRGAKAEGKKPPGEAARWPPALPRGFLVNDYSVSSLTFLFQRTRRYGRGPAASAGCGLTASLSGGRPEEPPGRAARPPQESLSPSNGARLIPV